MATRRSNDTTAGTIIWHTRIGEQWASVRIYSKFFIYLFLFIYSNNLICRQQADKESAGGILGRRLHVGRR